MKIKLTEITLRCVKRGMVQRILHPCAKEHILFTVCEIYILRHIVEPAGKVPTHLCWIGSFTVWTFHWEFCYIKKNNGFPVGISVGGD